MAGEVPDTGEGILIGALTGILSALTGAKQPVQAPIPVAPSIARPTVLGLPLPTLLLVGVGAFVVLKLLK